MDPEIAAMMIIAAVAIVLIISVASVVGTVKAARLRAERGLRKDWLGNELPVEDGASKARQGEIEELRERVKVLERIATDKSSQLADRIDDLRDKERTRD
ncbi:MAG TPA: hypothetical protein VLA37_04730 [Sphingomonadaceae bacterium]|nr:hypothetical protein [Sphingomonadaceae bacterium]